MKFKLIPDWVVRRTAAYKKLVAAYDNVAKDFADLSTNRATLRDIAVRNGNMTVEVATDTAAYFASLFYSLLEAQDAENYLEMQLKEKPGPRMETEFSAPAEPEKGFPDPHIVTLVLQRWNGKTPHQMRQIAEEKLAAAEEKLAAAEAEIKRLNEELGKAHASNTNKPGEPESDGNSN
jgi:hypothetical protein